MSGGKKQQQVQKTRVEIDTSTTTERIRELLYVADKPLISNSQNKKQIHSELKSDPTKLVTINLGDPVKISPLTPMGDQADIVKNLYVTAHLYPVKDAVGNYVVDEEGKAVENLLNRIARVYGDGLDNNPALKRNIYINAGMDPEYLDDKLAKPSLNAISPIVCKNTITNVDVQDPKYGTEDTTKSPTFRTKCWICPSDPKWETADSLILPGKNICFTKIFVPGRQKDTYVQAKTWNAIEPYTYRQGDSANGKQHYFLLAKLKFMPPTVYWTADKGKTNFGLTLSEIYITGKVLTQRAELSSLEQAEISLSNKRAASRMGVTLYDPYAENNNADVYGGANSNEMGNYADQGEDDVPYYDKDGNCLGGGEGSPPDDYYDHPQQQQQQQQQQQTQSPPYRTQQQSLQRQLKPNATVGQQNSRVTAAQIRLNGPPSSGRAGPPVVTNRPKWRPMPSSSNTNVTNQNTNYEENQDTSDFPQNDMFTQGDSTDQMQFDQNEPEEYEDPSQKYAPVEEDQMQDKTEEDSKKRKRQHAPSNNGSNGNNAKRPRTATSSTKK